MFAKKKYGQNFLINNTIISKIVFLLDLKDSDNVIEIGPGKGALTKEIVQNNCNLKCIEVDNDMHYYLDKFLSDKCIIIYKDILTIDLNELFDDKIKVIGNLPYYITSPILTYMTKYKNIETMVFMVQNEVADRLCAKPGNKEYGYFTLFMKYFFNITKEIYVSKENFNPVPKVDSAVIKLVKRKDRLNVNEHKYFGLLKNAFKFKRKTLKNNLSGYNWDNVLKILIENGFDDNVRAEEISEDIFVKICNNI